MREFTEYSAFVDDRGVCVDIPGVGEFVTEAGTYDDVTALYDGFMYEHSKSEHVFILAINTALGYAGLEIHYTNPDFEAERNEADSVFFEDYKLEDIIDIREATTGEIATTLGQWFQ
jgi:hypothetical protein